MLYEVVAQAKLDGISGDEFVRRLPQGLAYMKELGRKGIVRHSWVRVGGYGATNIFDVDSHEELLEHLNGNPLVPHIRYEVIPLSALSGFNGIEAAAVTSAD
ncbi:muconolactone Delta-isomerase family protein [Streptomyces sp. NPDC050636]|uniref:muconolactone Delta-isomerase family protein n=1 Tax=Streptomyces sp. NPDC050636 TaxID=3154510 RepID=UPI003414D6D6